MKAPIIKSTKATVSNLESAVAFGILRKESSIGSPSGKVPEVNEYIGAHGNGYQVKYMLGGKCQFVSYYIS